MELVRNGYIVCEAYFNGHTADELHTLQSVSKSFTSAVMGIATGTGRAHYDRAKKTLKSRLTND